MRKEMIPMRATLMHRRAQAWLFIEEITSFAVPVVRDKQRAGCLLPGWQNKGLERGGGGRGVIIVFSGAFTLSPSPR